MADTSHQAILDEFYPVTINKTAQTKVKFTENDSIPHEYEDTKWAL